MPHHFPLVLFQFRVIASLFQAKGGKTGDFFGRVSQARPGKISATQSHTSQVIYKKDALTLAYTIECVCFSLFSPQKVYLEAILTIFLHRLIKFLLRMLQCMYSTAK